jgi:hypothetical protein
MHLFDDFITKWHAFPDLLVEGFHEPQIHFSFLYPILSTTFVNSWFLAVKSQSCLCYAYNNEIVIKFVVVILSKVNGKGLPQQAEVAQGVPGRLRPRIFLSFGTTRVVGLQPYAPATFTPRRNPWYSFLEAKSTPEHMVPSVATEKNLSSWVSNTKNNWGEERGIDKAQGAFWKILSPRRGCSALRGWIEDRRSGFRVAGRLLGMVVEKEYHPESDVKT